jgi:hypothetical protein
VVYNQQAGLNPETLAQAFRDSVKYVAIPENAYDSQTWETKKTKANFFKEEQAELEPFPPGLFDHLITGQSSLSKTTMSALQPIGPDAYRPQSPHRALALIFIMPALLRFILAASGTV